MRTPVDAILARLRSLVAASALLAVSTAVAACGGSSSDAPGSWSEPAKVTGIRSLHAVSCPIAGWCVAVADKQALVYAGGSWSAP
jgi:hypothetical protein